MTKEYREWITYVILSVAMYTAQFYLSPLFGVLFLISPLPFMMLQYRFGTRSAMTAALVAILSIYLPEVFERGMSGITSPGLLMSILLFLLLFVFTGMLFGTLARTKKDAVDWLLSAVVVSVSVKVALLLFLTVITGSNPFTLDEASTEAMLAAISEAANVGTAADIKGYVQELAATMKLLLPSILICYSVLDSFCSYKLAARWLRRKEVTLAKFPPFGQWRFPKGLSFPILAALVLDLGQGFLPASYALKTVSANLMMVLRAIFTIEGMAVCWELMGRNKIGRALRLSVMTFSILFIALFSYPYSIVGIIDIWYDLRKRGGKKDESNSQTGR